MRPFTCACAVAILALAPSPTFGGAAVELAKKACKHLGLLGHLGHKLYKQYEEHERQEKARREQADEFRALVPSGPFRGGLDRWNEDSAPNRPLLAPRS